MFKKLLILIPIALFFGTVNVQGSTYVLPKTSSSEEITVERTLLASREMSLADRYPVPSVSEIFKDNILLTMAYMSGKVQSADQVDWDELHKPASFEFTLQPGEVFAFHDGVLPEFQDKTVVTSKSHYNASEGFRSSGYLYGDGVCHFASLMNWAARDAGLGVTAPVNHSFAKIPGIAPEYGTSIYYSAGEQSVNEQQNLYIENTFGEPVKFILDYKNDVMKVSVYK